MKALNIFFLLLILVSNIIGASPNPNNIILESPLVSKGEGPIFLIDYSNFQGIRNQTYVEFYIQIGYRQLQFIKHKGNFQAAYVVEFSIFDEHDKIIEDYSNEDFFDVETYKETQSIAKARAMLLAFNFECGQYKLKVKITDKETQHSSKIEETFYTKPFQTKKLSISDIQFSQKITPAEDSQPYVKNQRYIEPNAGRVFTHGISSGIYIYFEVYNLDYCATDENPTYTCFFIFHNSEGKQIGLLKRKSIKPGLTSAQSFKIPLEGFRIGEYLLEIRVLDDDTQQIIEVSKKFTVMDSNIILSKIDQDGMIY